MAKPIENNDDHRFQYLIVRPEKGTIWNLLHFSVSGHIPSFSTFIDTKLLHENNNNNNEEQEETSSLIGPIYDHRWIILVSILIRKIIAFFAKPMELFGFLVDFVLNLLSHNGNLLGLLHNFIHGQVVIPERGTETFISTIGQLDGRIDLYKKRDLKPEMGNRALMDLCIMASKLAYENAQVIKKIVNHHWKMHFVEFYNCWNDFQNEKSTQVFILCDKAKDANFILISFRGTELFDAADWITDFDYSWYEIPKMGKVHIGFLEALGLGNRVEPDSFYFHLQMKNRKLSSSIDVNVSEPLYSNTDSDSDSDLSSSSETPQVEKKTAYYTLRSKLRSLLEEHRNAKFIVTGHSLGGALAILFPTVLVMHEEMDIMEKLLGVYTFGQPRIGDRKLGRFMETHLKQHVPKYFRVVYCNDLVPRLPYDNKTFLYKHFGECLYYNSLYNEKEVKEEPNRNFFGMKFALSEHVNAMWELIRGLTIGYIEGPEYKEGWIRILIRLIGLVLPGISAHCTTDYVNSIRLAKNSSIQMSSI
ncbi:putative triacylglycerol lipase [Lupinus albus]|uniref:Putative triacylglycerol lipase n=1 Tax=Lupinus albus TaxID=3870 RepID=A0A6A4QSZ9_LUPAL|nr:putative triacylglycerol lipase [Lupinus albus]